MNIRTVCRSQCPRGLRRRSSAARLLRLWVRILPGAWMCVCCECCVLSGRGLCDELITRPEKSYRLWYVVVCDLETSWMRRSWPTGSCRAKNKQTDKHLLGSLGLAGTAHTLGEETKFHPTKWPDYLWKQAGRCCCHRNFLQESLLTPHGTQSGKQCSNPRISIKCM